MIVIIITLDVCLRTDSFDISHGVSTIIILTNPSAYLVVTPAKLIAVQLDNVSQQELSTDKSMLLLKQQ